MSCTGREQHGRGDGTELHQTLHGNTTSVTGDKASERRPGNSAARRASTRRSPGGRLAILPSWLHALRKPSNTRPSRRVIVEVSLQGPDPIWRCRVPAVGQDESPGTARSRHALTMLLGRHVESRLRGGAGQRAKRTAGTEAIMGGLAQGDSRRGALHPVFRDRGPSRAARTARRGLLQ